MTEHRKHKRLAAAAALLLAYGAGAQAGTMTETVGSQIDASASQFGGYKLIFATPIVGADSLLSVTGGGISASAQEGGAFQFVLDIIYMSGEIVPLYGQNGPTTDQSGMVTYFPINDSAITNKTFDAGTITGLEFQDNTSIGQIRILAGTTFSFDVPDVVVPPAPAPAPAGVPEPLPLALAGIGAVAALGARKRRANADEPVQPSTSE